MNARIISLEESQRLLQFLGSYEPRSNREAALLGRVVASIGSAMIVPSSRLPRTAVSMYSTVKIVDLDRHEAFTHTLVYPPDAREYRSDLSVLTPMGAAILGVLEGDVIVEELDGWRVDVSSGAVRFAVKEVLYQPEWDQRNRFSHSGPIAGR